MSTTGYEETLSADGQTTAQNIGGPVRLSLTGDFGTGTAKLQAQTPTGNWVDVANGSFTAATDKLFDFPVQANNKLRVDISSSSSPALVVWLQADSGDFG